MSEGNTPQADERGSRSLDRLGGGVKAVYRAASKWGAAAVKGIRPDMQAALVGAVATIGAGLITLLATPGIYERLFKESELHARHITSYCRVNHFRDRAFDEAPVYSKAIGQKGSRLVRVEDVFDEADYTIFYEFRPHTVPIFEFLSHSSGLTEGTTLDPPLFTPGGELESYEKSNGRVLTLPVDLRDEDGGYLERVVCWSRNYNGFQMRGDKIHYESDAGLHIRFATDAALFIVDFSGVPHQELLAGEPKMYLEEEGGKRHRLDSSFEYGVARCTVKRPPLKSSIICDWQWRTEARTAPSPVP